MSFIKQEKSELMAKFEKLLEGVENRFYIAAFCADIAIEHADTKVKNVAANYSVFKWIKLVEQEPYPRQKIIGKKDGRTWAGNYSTGPDGKWCQGMSFDEWMAFPI